MGVQTKVEAGLAERRRFDPDRTRQDILWAARVEFAEHGLSGARVDAIAARTDTVKRMIYYYFGSKEGLYLAVLEQAYADIRRAEQELGLDGFPPVEAIRRLVAFTFDYDEAHPEFIRLVSNENMYHAQHLGQSAAMRDLNKDAISTLEQVLDRGKQSGVFTRVVDPVDIHMLISSFCFFRVANRYTFGAIFGQDLSAPATKARHKQMLANAVLDTLGATGRPRTNSG